MLVAKRNVHCTATLWRHVLRTERLSPTMPDPAGSRRRYLYVGCNARAVATNCCAWRTEASCGTALLRSSRRHDNPDFMPACSGYAPLSRVPARTGRLAEPQPGNTISHSPNDRQQAHRPGSSLRILPHASIDNKPTGREFVCEAVGDPDIFTDSRVWWHVSKYKMIVTRTATAADCGLQPHR